MNPITVAIGVLLAASLAGNAFLFDALGESREEATRADAGRLTAAAAAQSCSNYVGKLSADAKTQADQAQAAIDAAKEEARKANLRAGGERNRTQAVPGNACASAQVETREWLQNRRSRDGR